MKSTLYDFLSGDAFLELNQNKPRKEIGLIRDKAKNIKLNSPVSQLVWELQTQFRPSSIV
jgi:hypothetical protein